MLTLITVGWKIVPKVLSGMDLSLMTLNYIALKWTEIRLV